MAANSDYQLLFDNLRSRLTDDDDLTLWQTVIETIFADAEFLCNQKRRNQEIYAQIGCCSHWMSPHNKGSWFKNQQFAWPTGYGNDGFTIFGLPEFDWCETWKRNDSENIPWQHVDQVKGKRPLIFRVAVPARTKQHVRSVVHTVWTPGSPTRPDKKLTQGYAFEKQNDIWSCVATYGDETVYDPNT